jgi:hypothetical protein
MKFLTATPVMLLLILSACSDQDKETVSNQPNTHKTNTTQKPEMVSAHPENKISVAEKTQQPEEKPKTKQKVQQITAKPAHKTIEKIPEKVTKQSHQTGVIIKPAQLMAKPYSDAKPLHSLAKDTKVNIIKRKGGWYQIKSNKLTGWVRMMALRKNPGTNKTGSLQDSLSLATGRMGSGNVAATSGIRGLDEENLKAAKNDNEAVKQLENFAITKQQALAFGRKNNLQQQQIPYLP